VASAEVLTEVGRIVTGHPLKMVPVTDDEGKPVLKDDGTPKMQINFGLALPKATFGNVSTAMGAAAVGIPGADQAGFAWKYKDGDTAVDQRGNPYRDKPGMAGCYIIFISTEIRELCQVFRNVGAGQYQTMTEGEVKCGDFVRVRLNIVGHGAHPQKRGSKAGLYLNPVGVEFIGYGKAIFSGPNAVDMFGSAPVAALPPGASATPIAAAPSFTPPGIPAPVAGPSFTPPGIAPVAAPTMPAPSPVGLPSPAPIASPSNPPMPTPVAPAHDFVQNAVGGPPGAPAPMPVAAPVAAPPAPAPAPAPGGLGRTPVGFDAATGRPIFGYTSHNGTNYPIFGFNPDGTPIYQ